MSAARIGGAEHQAHIQDGVKMLVKALLSSHIAMSSRSEGTEQRVNAPPPWRPKCAREPTSHHQ